MNSEIIDRANRVFTPAFHFYHPISIAGGQGCRITDLEGKSYLDCASGLGTLNIGHNHPRVMAAVARQLTSFCHTGGVYYNETTVAAAELLTSITPPGLNRLFFSNSGAEAVEGALKLARYVTGRQGIISFAGAFHGRTLGAISLTSSNARYRERYSPLLPSVYHAPYPHCLRCPFGCSFAGCNLDCLGYLEEMLRRYISPEEVAAIIIEPVLGEGGYVPAPTKYLKGLRRLCDEHGILLIFDEVQSGMGRCGDWFAAQVYGITPDILTVAKGIASGFPLSAVVSRSDLMDQWPSWAHGTTFGGNPVSCAAAIATIEAIQDDGLLARCRELGAAALGRLMAFQEQHPLVGDVRGLGLMIGVELVGSDGKPDGAACAQVLEECLQQGLIVINCGAERNVIRLIPPLTISDEEMGQALDILEQTIETAGK
ncbi:MAG: aspartate aminotransferase family protein [Steroidobacteraceae bacterium]|nr:aspartate aminotransferase family protein [Deltaproteobacteria bacterium]